MSIEWIIMLMAVTAMVAGALAFREGYSQGTEAGWNEGYDFATGTQETRWRLTASGESALAAERQALAELSLHRSPDNLSPESIQS